MTVKIVVDSASCLPKNVANQHGIVVLQMQANEEPAEKSAFGAANATTSALSPLELCAAYSRQLALGNDEGVVVLHVSKALSSTWSNGSTAAEVLGDRVQVVDTQSVGMGIGFAAIAAAQCAERGGSVEECAEAAKEVLQRSSMWAYLPHMEHLRRGGRLAAGATIISTALAMKPVVTLRDGKIELAAKTRTETKALSRLVELVVAESGDDPVDVAVQYAGPQRNATELARVLKRFLGETASVQMAEISPAVMVHSGPDALMVSIVRKPIVGLRAGEVDAADPLQPSLFDGTELLQGQRASEKGALRSDNANGLEAAATGSATAKGTANATAEEEDTVEGSASKIFDSNPVMAMPASPTEQATAQSEESWEEDGRAQTWANWRETFRQATERASDLAAEIAAEFTSERAKRAAAESDEAEDTDALSDETAAVAVNSSNPELEPPTESQELPAPGETATDSEPAKSDSAKSDSAKSDSGKSGSAKPGKAKLKGRGGFKKKSSSTADIPDDTQIEQ